MLLDSAYRDWRFTEIADNSDWYLSCSNDFKVRHRQIVSRSFLKTGRISDAKRLVGRNLKDADAGTALLIADVWNAADDDEFARSAYERALSLAPYNPVIQLFRAYHLLKLGQMREGFLQWSSACAVIGEYPALPKHRIWRGEPLAGRHIVVLFEYGFGDMIQFSRFLPELQAKHPAALITAKVPQPLVRLFMHAFPDIKSSSRPDLRSIDYYISSMQLPLSLGVSRLTPTAGYIRRIPTARRDDADRLKVGFCWRGRPLSFDAARSMSVEQMSSLFDLPNREFVALVHQTTEIERAFLARFPNVSLPEFSGFHELLGLVGDCDAIVTVDTSVAHLAAAAGIKVFLLTRPDSCWRWGMRGSQNPWYESVTVMRHDEDMDWPLLISRTKELLCASSDRRAMVG